MLLKNKTAVITGCNKGIGKKIVEVFSANGATIFACVRNINQEFKDFISKTEKISVNALPVNYKIAQGLNSTLAKIEA